MTGAVRPAESADLDAVLECWLALIESQRTHGSHLEAAANRSIARDLLGQYIVGDMLAVAGPAGSAPGGPIRGFVTFYREHGVYEQDRPRGVIENIYVDPDWRGEGIGSALLDYAESALADRDATVLTLSAMAANDQAIAWYEDHGYTPHRIEFERTLDGESEGKV